MGAVLEPGEEIGGALDHSVLDVAFAAAVAGEGDVHPAENPVLEPGLPFGLIKEVASEVALAEEQPGAAVRAARLALLEEGAIGGDAGAGADHDDRLVVLRKAELRVGLDVDGQCVLHGAAVGKMGGSDPVPRFAVELVADRGERDMRFVRHRREAGGNGIEAWLERPQARHESFGIDTFRRESPHYVDDVVGSKPLLALGLAFVST